MLLWFGYSLFFGSASAGTGFTPSRRGRPRFPPPEEGAFPAMGRAERLMHISGCMYCLGGGRLRSCPVCGAALDIDEILVARMFEKPRRSHVHVLGCSRCRKAGRAR